MYPVMNSASKANGILFVLVLAAMFVYSLPPVFSFARTQTDTWNLFVDGKLLRKFEQVYDKRFFLREPSVELWADAQFKLFGEGTKGVVLGKQGWLYTTRNTASRTTCRPTSTPSWSRSPRSRRSWPSTASSW